MLPDSIIPHRVSRTQDGLLELLVVFAYLVIILTLMSLTEWLQSIHGSIVWINEPVHASLECAGASTLILSAIILLFSGTPERKLASRIWTVCSLLMMGVLNLVHSALHPGFAYFWTISLSTMLGGVVMNLNWLPDRIVDNYVAKWAPIITVLSAMPPIPETRESCGRQLPAILFLPARLPH